MRRLFYLGAFMCVFLWPKRKEVEERQKGRRRRRRMGWAEGN
jgi:hypothetical protein